VALDQQVTEAAGDRREQHVIDGAAQFVADPLDSAQAGSAQTHRRSGPIGPFREAADGAASRWALRVRPG
jgi:hypothetical protein